MIDVALTLEEVRGIPLAGVTAVVLDVVRASTTIVAALAGGAQAVVPVATPDEARALRRDGQARARPRRRRAGRRAPAGLRPRKLAGRVHARPRPRPHGRLHDDERHPGAPRPRGRAPDRGRRLRQRRGGRPLGVGGAGRRPPGVRGRARALLPGGRGLRRAARLAPRERGRRADRRGPRGARSLGALRGRPRRHARRRGVGPGPGGAGAGLRPAALRRPGRPRGGPGAPRRRPGREPR